MSKCDICGDNEARCIITSENGLRCQACYITERNSLKEMPNEIWAGRRSIRHGSDIYELVLHANACGTKYIKADITTPITSSNTNAKITPVISKIDELIKDLNRRDHLDRQRIDIVIERLENLKKSI